MYQIQLRLSTAYTKFKAAGTARVRAKVVSEKLNNDGTIHKCNNGEYCTVGVTHTLTAKSKEPFALFINGSIVIASNEEGHSGVLVYSRNIGGFYVWSPSDRPIHTPRF